MPELFSGMDIADMDFHKRYSDTRKSVSQAYARVRKTTRVDDNELCLATSLVDSVDDCAFVVGLEVLDLDSQIFALRFGGRHDV